MSPDLIELLRSVLIEAIKVLGPAFLTYLAASSQFRSTLKKTEVINNFKARQHLFLYYNKRQKRLDKDYYEINKGIGTVIGLAAGMTTFNNEELANPVKAFLVLLEIYIAVAPVEIDITTRDMGEKDLFNSAEYIHLQEAKKGLINLAPGTTAQQLRECSVKLLTIYASLQRCNQLLIEQKIKKTLDLKKDSSE